MNEREINDKSTQPNENDELQSARLSHKRLDVEWSAYNIKSLQCNEEDGKNGRDAKWALNENDEVAANGAQVPSLLGIQVMEANRNANYKSEWVCDRQVG